MLFGLKLQLFFIVTLTPIHSERDTNNKPIIAKYGQNYTTLIARYCQGRVPRSCDHAVLNETHARPCTMLESYVSSGEFVTLELRNTESTVLRFTYLYSYIYTLNMRIICVYPAPQTDIFQNAI